MVKKLVPMMTAFLLLLLDGAGGGGNASAKEILVVQGGTIAPYEEAITGFEQATTALDGVLGVKSILPAQLSRIVVNPGEDIPLLQEKIKGRQPGLLLAVGQKALEALSGIDEIPIVYLMVANPDQVRIRAGNLIGVKLALAPERQLAALAERMPAIRRVGVIYDPRHSAPLVAAADKFLASQGRQLVAVEATEAKEIAPALQAMNGAIDGLWMVPDRTVITSASLETMALFSMQTHIPIITFSEKYLETGALLAITSDPLAMGKQAGVLASRILQGVAVQKMSAEEPAFAKITTNEYVAGHLGPLPSAAAAASGKTTRGGQP